MEATYIGDAYAIHTPKGRVVACAYTPIGVRADGSLVVADRPADVEAGGFTLAECHEAFTQTGKAIAIDYDRDRPIYGARFWRHEFSAPIRYALNAIGQLRLDGRASTCQGDFLCDPSTKERSP